MLSGANRPGLIEAGLQRLFGIQYRRYPGQTAPASLKPHERTATQVPVTRYPGQTAPASLKLYRYFFYWGIK